MTLRIIAPIPFVAVLCFASTIAAAQTRVVVDAELIRNRLLEANAQVDTMRKLASDDPAMQQQLDVLFKHLRRIRRVVKRAPVFACELAAPVVVAVPAPVVMAPPPPPPPTPPAALAIAAPQLDAIVRAIENEAFGSNKLQVLDQAIAPHQFLVGQVVRLIALFTFENEKLEVLRKLAPRIVDRENAFQVYEAFRFSSSKGKAREILSPNP